MDLDDVNLCSFCGEVLEGKPRVKVVGERLVEQPCPKCPKGSKEDPVR